MVVAPIARSSPREREGFNILEALDGEDALKKAKSEKPHLMLLDLILPGIDGFETLKQIRADDEIGKTPVIVLSNLGQKDAVEKAKRLGATDVKVIARRGRKHFKASPWELEDAEEELHAQAHPDRAEVDLLLVVRHQPSDAEKGQDADESHQARHSVSLGQGEACS